MAGTVRSGSMSCRLAASARREFVRSLLGQGRLRTTEENAIGQADGEHELANSRIGILLRHSRGQA